MSILSTNHRLISIGESYSAGNGIDITDQIISVTGNVVPYSAGDNIDIQDHVISGKDWTQDITDASSNAFNETTAWVHDNYANSADVSYLSGVVDNKLDTSAWSSVSSNFATEDYVIMADNITYDRATGYIENQQFAKESACQSAFEQLNTNKLNSSSFTDWQNGQYATDLQTIEGQITNKLDTSSFSEVSGNFQPRGDYAERDTVYSAIESATSSKLDVSSFASVSSDFLTTSFGISESATWNEVSTTVQSNSARWADGGSGDEEVNSFVYNNSATINEVNTAYQTHSASYQPSGNYIPYTGYSASLGYVTNSPFTIHDGSFTNSLGRANIFIENRITSNIYNNMVAGPTYVRFSTPSDSAQVDIPSINKWNDLSTTVQTNSAQWAEGGGSNPEVESYVINNSATIDEVNTTYQSNSASYLTAHQSLTNYYTTAEANSMSSMLSGAIDYVSANAGGAITSYTTATIEGTNAINSLNGKPIISFRAASAQEAGVANKARYDYNGNNLADDHNSLTALNGVVQTNSATWGQGGNVPVSNSGDLYKVEFDGVDLYGYKKTTTIPNYVYTAMKSSTGNYIEAHNHPNFDNVGFSSTIGFFNNADIITFSSNGEGIYPSEDARYGTTALDVYYLASNLKDWYNNPLADFSGYIGKITLDNLVTSSYIKKPSYFNNIFACGNFDLWFSSNYGHDGFPSEYVLSLVDEALTSTSTFEGIFVPSALPTYEYDNTNKISAINGSAIAAGDEFPVSANEAITAYQSNSANYLTAHQTIPSAKWENASDCVQTNSASWAGGNSDTFYIYPGTTTDKEISENSGKDMKLYNSANNVYLDFAGKSTLSTYTMFSFKEVTGTQVNQNTVQHLRLRVYPNATSACKVYDTNTVNLLDSNSTVSTAQTAYYDGNGNSLETTHNDLTALNQFVQTNSANWGQGGGGSDVTPLGLWLGYEYDYPKAFNNTNDAYNITLRNTQWEEPQSIYYDGNSHNWNGSNGDWYIGLTTIYPNDMRAGLPYNDSNETRFTVMEFTNTNTQEKYSANITINGDSLSRTLSVNNSACVISAVGEYVSFNVDYIDGQGPHQLSSWQGTHDYVSGGFSNSQATAFFIGADTNYSTAYIGFAKAGSTVASSDVFPPTNNLDHYATYYLGWNANNGGLFWYNPGNGGN